jgi:hypothetical protein
VPAGREIAGAGGAGARAVGFQVEPGRAGVLFGGRRRATAAETPSSVGNARGRPLAVAGWWTRARYGARQGADGGRARRRDGLSSTLQRFSSRQGWAAGAPIGREVGRGRTFTIEEEAG